ncbi:DUF711 family protein [Phytohabitans houttuyneae]|uniref:DUF711 family protein n=1 Tax=Phytohabitans houttuyneae TaxID=1076126 RepID=A0A6V8KQY3_9ACTN|nr:DUF711 family protein [Phytohabitans houttuyneae]GFJ85028.1 hypothetical protein Phou_092080 [Phytohabitans houttuyneae]
MNSDIVRTITLGLADRHPLDASVVEQAKWTLDQARNSLEMAGFTVQTIRLSTRPVLHDLRDWHNEARSRYLRDFHDVVRDAGLEFCSLGIAGATSSCEDIAWLGDALVQHPAFSGSVQLATRNHGVDFDRCVAVAEVVRRLSQESEEGFGNFRFAGVAMMSHGCPFFPAASHGVGPTGLTVGLQSASAVVAALSSGCSIAEVPELVRRTLIAHAGPVVTALAKFGADHGVGFDGIDLSPAPLGHDSLAAAFEAFGLEFFGSAGTLSLAAALTEGIQTTGLPTRGYNGLMLAVLEDSILGQRWAQRLVDIDKLLYYSAVCGTGLDALPLAGDVSVGSLARVLSDIGTLAVRLAKPLSGRLMPVPGKRDGEMTTFRSPYVTNTVIHGLAAPPTLIGDA